MTPGSGGMSKRGGLGRVEGGCSACVRSWLGLGYVKGVRDAWLGCRARACGVDEARAVWVRTRVRQLELQCVGKGLGT